ncbi:hypothetical protein CSUI_003721 [Cystoisospora suis]|uniref:Uncharacterized protein n=1 Tax=Cystoisospora suis TaxID=483139 RepID=A0A2C6KPL1_9APIC|nr:hypothetical protein CSUI_003721 [Cystoisospora suis]
MISSRLRSARIGAGRRYLRRSSPAGLLDSLQATDTLCKRVARNPFVPWKTWTRKRDDNSSVPVALLPPPRAQDATSLQAIKASRVPVRRPPKLRAKERGNGTSTTFRRTRPASSASSANCSPNLHPVPKSDRPGRSSARYGNGVRGGSSCPSAELRSVSDRDGCPVVAEGHAASAPANPPAPPWSPAASIFASSSSLNHIRRHHICTSCRCSLQLAFPSGAQQPSLPCHSGSGPTAGLPSCQHAGHKSVSAVDTSASSEEGRCVQPCFSGFSSHSLGGFSRCRGEGNGGRSSVWSAFPKPTEPLVFVNDIRRGLEARQIPGLQKSLPDPHARPPRAFFITLRSLKGNAKSCTATAARVVPEDAVRVSVE